MTIKIKAQGSFYAISFKEVHAEREHFKLVFDSGEELFFKVDKELYDGDDMLVLDTKLTDPVLVDEILLPQADAEDKQDARILSVITPEQCKRLRIANLFWDRYFVPQSGKGMYVWKTSLFNLEYGSRYEVMKGRILRSIEHVVTLGP
jgi:hypothetical protein